MLFRANVGPESDAARQERAPHQNGQLMGVARCAHGAYFADINSERWPLSDDRMVAETACLCARL